MYVLWEEGRRGRERERKWYVDRGCAKEGEMDEEGVVGKRERRKIVRCVRLKWCETFTYVCDVCVCACLSGRRNRLGWRGARGIVIRWNCNFSLTRAVQPPARGVKAD